MDLADEFFFAAGLDLERSEFAYSFWSAVFMQEYGKSKRRGFKAEKKVEAINESESLPSKKIRNSMGILIRN
ncbi:hypothetical protein [Allobaculum sp. JKK-2023]|uniref:hypothetical protein n=1 Tax=Allobaculum sp. JKK-2023 TaxID=3108943 RepID=UPI002B05D2DD|nr:hypothetical protein [Allobaculum sp. JKK-2023]